MQENIAEIENLSHKYSSSWAIQNINFQIARYGVLGLLGSNGAGKSTTMNIMCGVLKQTSGEVRIGGVDMLKEPERAKKLIGFLPQTAPLYLDLTIDEYLHYCANLRLMNRKIIPAAIAEAKELCGIAHFSKRIIGNLSGGYRQRVGIAQAIIHKPRLVVLDEATNGLDPNQIIEVRALIRQIAEERSVIFSSHILSEIQASCREIIMIEDGKIVFSDTMDAFNNYLAPDTLTLTMEAPPAIERLREIPGITKAEFTSSKNYRLHFNPTPDLTERIIELSVTNGWRLTQLSLEKSSLDEIFAQLSNKATKKQL